MRQFLTLWQDEEGVAAAETAIVIAVVALAGIGLWQHFGEVSRGSADDAANLFPDGGSSPTQ
jgi:Flp pilus assembly pilin Flp